MNARPSPALERRDAALLGRLAAELRAGGVASEHLDVWARELAHIAAGIHAAVEFAGTDCALDYLDELLLLQLLSELEQYRRLVAPRQLAPQVLGVAGRLDRWLDQLGRAA